MACRRFRQAIRDYGVLTARGSVEQRTVLFCVCEVDIIRGTGLPVPHPAGIDMHEIGVGVVANSPPFHGYRGFPEFGQGASGQSDIYSLPLHV